jgi:hypothetical protein
LFLVCSSQLTVYSTQFTVSRGEREGDFVAGVYLTLSVPLSVHREGGVEISLLSLLTKEGRQYPKINRRRGRDGWIPNPRLKYGAGGLGMA